VSRSIPPARERRCVRTRELGINLIDTADSYGPEVSANLLETIAKMRQDGYIRHVGLSEVSIGDIEEAQQYFPVVTVQNLYNLIDRKSEAVLDYCEAHGIGFIPWFPLAAGDLAAPGSVLSQIAKRLSVTPSQVALAWILQRSPVMLPIPGTSRIDHLEENLAAAALRLSIEDFAELDRQARRSKA
jgi:pyridoxine 4-dehydrogenase